MWFTQDALRIIAGYKGPATINQEVKAYVKSKYLVTSQLGKAKGKPVCYQLASMIPDLASVPTSIEQKIFEIFETDNDEQPNATEELNSLLRTKFSASEADLVFDVDLIAWCEKQDPAETLREMKVFFANCIPSGEVIAPEENTYCWDSTAVKPYKKVMQWKYPALTGPLLRSFGNYEWERKQDGRALSICNCPIFCESQREDHKWCCRPAHLKYGTQNENMEHLRMANAIRKLNQKPELPDIGKLAEDAKMEENEEED